GKVPAELEENAAHRFSRFVGAGGDENRLQGAELRSGDGLSEREERRDTRELARVVTGEKSAADRREQELAGEVGQEDALDGLRQVRSGDEVPQKRISSSPSCRSDSRSIL